MKNMKPISISAVLFSAIMLLLGIVVVLFTLIKGDLGPGGSLAQKLGFAFIVTGVVVMFQESVTKRIPDGVDEQFIDMKERLDALSAKVNERSEVLTNKLDGGFRHFEEAYGTKALAMRYIINQRAGYDEYHHWLVHTAPEDLFFAGHSVLHRVQIDMDRRGLGKLEEAIVHKVIGGSTLRLVYLDPTWEFVKNIAEGEGQSYERILTDLTVTLGICRRLWGKLEEKEQIAIPGSIDIRMCKEVQQYAFHSVTNKETKKTIMLVGLYFADVLGMNSPLFSVEHKNIQDTFAAHFSAIGNRGTSTSLLQYDPPIRHFNHDFYHHCREHLIRAGVPQSTVELECPE